MGIDFDPRVGAFKEVMQVVQKYTAYFARENNEECEQSCMADRPVWHTMSLVADARRAGTVRYLLESINPEIRL